MRFLSQLIHHSIQRQRSTAQHSVQQHFRFAHLHVLHLTTLHFSFSSSFLRFPTANSGTRRDGRKRGNQQAQRSYGRTGISAGWEVTASIISSSLPHGSSKVQRNLSGLTASCTTLFAHLPAHLCITPLPSVSLFDGSALVSLLFPSLFHVRYLLVSLFIPTRRKIKEKIFQGFDAATTTKPKKKGESDTIPLARAHNTGVTGECHERKVAVGIPIPSILCIYLSLSFFFLCFCNCFLSPIVRCRVWLGHGALRFGIRTLCLY